MRAALARLVRAAGPRGGGPSLRRLPREVFGLSAVSFCVALGYGIVAPAIPLFAQEFGVGATAAGAVVSAFALVRLVFALGGGRVVDLLGERVSLAVGIGVVAVSSLLAGLATNYSQLLVLRGIGGAGSVVFTVAGMSLVLRVAAPAVRGQALGVYQGGFVVGGIVGPAVGGLVLTFSLRAPFFVYAATLVVAAAVALVALAGRPGPATAGAVPSEAGGPVGEPASAAPAMLGTPETPGPASARLGPAGPTGARGEADGVGEADAPGEVEARGAADAPGEVEARSAADAPGEVEARGAAGYLDASAATTTGGPADAADPGEASGKASAAEPIAVTRPRPAPTPLRVALRRPPYRAALAANFVVGFSLFGVRSALVPLLLVDAVHAGAGWVGIAFLVGTLTQTLTLLPAGRLGDQLGRRLPLGAGGLVAAAGLAGLAVGRTLGLVLLAMAVLGVGSAFLSTAPPALLGDAVPERGGVVVAGYSMAADLGSVLGPVVAGLLVDRGSYGVAFGVAAALAATTAILAARLPSGTLAADGSTAG